uniref:Uncharacterized protein n=1 Tax=Arundo donax TaxID=35708 RepID=A0A0A8YLS4_ARUDO
MEGKQSYWLNYSLLEHIFSTEIFQVGVCCLI